VVAARTLVDTARCLVSSGVDSLHTLVAAMAALERLASGQVLGKVVVSIDR
jgi:hypothetical protein